MPGKKMKVARWIHAGTCVVKVQVDAVVPDEDPSKPCLEPATLRWLDELQELADAGRINELAQHGTVYVRRSA
ncbi:MAG: hypothetical protein WC058_02910 [Phycisphaeraceae bacterium]